MARTGTARSTMNVAPAPASLAPSPTRRRWLWLSRLSGWPLCLTLVCGALAVRLVGISTNYDIFGDEVNYTTLGLSARRGVFPPQFAGSPFLLHPPGFFEMLAAWFDVRGVSGGDYFHQLVEARELNAVLGAVTAGLLFWIGARLWHRAAGFVTAVLFTIDPFILRQNGRVMLETSTVMWVLAGGLVLLPLFTRRTRHPMVRAVAGGLLLGTAIVFNDIAVVLVLPPLAVAWWRNWGASGRRPLAAAFGAAVVPYVVYLVGLAAVGSLGLFANQLGDGLERMLGLNKITGFNRAGAPSLIHTMLIELDTFGATYVLCGIGTLAALWLVWRRWPGLGALRTRRWWRPASARPTLVRPAAVAAPSSAERSTHGGPGGVDNGVMYMTTVALFGIATLGYAVSLGTIEEQFLYYLYVPVLLVLPVAVAVMLRQWTVRGGRRRARFWRAAACALLIGLVVYDATVAWQIRATPDNGEQRLVTWFEHHAPHPGLIANDTNATTLLLQASDFTSETVPPSLRTMARDHVRYVTISSLEMNEGYDTAPKPELRTIERTATAVYSVTGRFYGTLTVFRTDDPRLW